MTVPNSSGSGPLYVRVRELLQRGAGQAAADLVDAALAHAPRDADALYLRGVIANQRRDQGAAIAALEQAIAVRPDMALAWLAMGNAYSRSGQFGAAANAYRAVLAREPGWADAHFNLGLMMKRQGELLAAARSLYAAWSTDPMLFEAAKQCVATVADCVRSGEACASPAPGKKVVPRTISVVLCSIDDSRCDRAVALYRRLLANIAHEIIVIRDARSLAESYNRAIASSQGEIVLLSHDDIDVLAPDFAARLLRQLLELDVVGVVGCTRMDGPAVGWSGHPHLRGWITHHSPTDA